jgi:excisionase family DNA binding protein
MEAPMAAKEPGKTTKQKRPSRRGPPVDGQHEREERWYTTSEAAEYLGVSQPTVFRWMKEGVLSFYRIGGSTRFTREGLDAVIQKTTGSREAEASIGRCASCGHGVLVPGRMQGTGRLYFKPDKSRFWVLTDSLVGLTATVCAACGFVQLRADTRKLGRLVADQESEEG